MFNRQVQGWINYYSHFYKSALIPLFQHLNQRLIRWAMRKFKNLKGHKARARAWLQEISHRQSTLFAHWRFLYVNDMVKQ